VHTVKETLDKLFKHINFNKNLYKKLVYTNIEFISKTPDHKNLFGSRQIGCHYLKYNISDKDDFYSSLFNLDYETVSEAIKSITTVPDAYKIARDDINLVCFYMAHRFLTNQELKENDREEYAIEALNYFNYRTLVLISANYFIYPISEEKAVSLTERLSNKYLIKRLKNWNEYCQYRSKEYIDSKFKDLLISFSDDKELPNAINDLYNRTKDTIKNIYSELIDMVQSQEYIRSKKSVVNDIEGQEVMLDKIGNTQTYYNSIESVFSDKQTFIRSSYIDVITDIINSVSYKQLYTCLEYLYDYAHSGSKNYEEVIKFMHDVLDNSVEYLLKNKIILNSNSDVISVLNLIIGNVLYSRGENTTINHVKDRAEELIKKVYAFSKDTASSRNVKNIRNAVFLYILLNILVQGQ
jgi:hypothetical protein